MLKRCLCFLLTALVVSATSCSKDSGPEAPSEPDKVLLAYIGTDNNLQAVAYQKLHALRDGWSGSEHQKIVVYLDYKGVPSSLIEIGYAEGSGEKTLKTVKTYNRENSASAATLSRVISEVAALYPAEQYGLLVFSHASGWLPAGALNNPALASASKSIIADDSFGEMELQDFAAAIPGGMFDYIVFETCFMAGIEAAYALREKTPLILASSAEIVDPGFTPVYASAVDKLFSGEIISFGQRVFDRVLTYGENEVQRSATYSVIRTDKLERLAAFIRDHCDVTQPVDIGQVQHFDRHGDYRLFFDFGDYYGRLLKTDDQRQELGRLVADCIPWKAATPQFMTQSSGHNGFAITRHSGLTTYIPQPAFPALNRAYGELGWSRAITR